MSATEKHVRLAAELYDMRATVRRLLGDSYRAQMDALGAVLTLYWGGAENPISAAMDCVKQRQLEGFDVAKMMAAAVELAEPTP